MRGRALIPAAPCILALLAGCGSSGTRTVSVSNSQSATPSAASATSSSAATSSRTATTGSSGPSSTAGNGQTSGQGAPAFVAPSGGSGSLSAAESVLQARGYSAVDPGSYHPAQTLRVLVGARQGSADAHVQQAFFFVGGRFLGTDTSDSSAQIRVVSQNDTSVTLGYSLYRPGDPLCCASGGQGDVTYQLDNGRLRPLNPIPSSSPSAARSRQ